MYHVAYLEFMFYFFGSEKGLLKFVSERIKLVYRINLLGTAFKKKLPLKLLKP